LPPNRVAIASPAHKLAHGLASLTPSSSFHLFIAHAWIKGALTPAQYLLKASYIACTCIEILEGMLQPPSTHPKSALDG